jgi:hypothetical protein
VSACAFFVQVREAVDPDGYSLLRIGLSFSDIPKD